MDGKLERFIEAHKCKPAVAFKIAQRSSGLDLIGAAKVEKPGTLIGALVVKTWTKCKSGMLWCYLLSESGVLYSFPAFYDRGGDGPFAKAECTTLGTKVKASFIRGANGKVYCDGIEEWN